ncbi:MAG TPA: 23S rRNA (adenine(2503)-C(2))-methyltransferase RlmN [Bacteroidetes bacterium]|nr:23S rRNA (adenine(2503)-C(2))-methyltransferase RlmN [Bacteroidota bacterium]HEX03801.1 23S rRNA (adenine(2503)-C(2))-methyltransferase RlmN [Bacteroidota bacterium]
MMMTKDKTGIIPLLGYSRDQLIELLNEMGYRPFHAKQLYSWIYYRGVFEFDQMTDLSKKLREELNSRFVLQLPRIVEQVQGEDPDSASKFLFELSDGERVEAVNIPTEDRNTVCLSCQVGCAFGCTFCATGQMGLSRNMTAAEIIGSFLAIRQNSEARISNVVFMGMGEPLANLEQVMKAYDLLTDGDGIALSKRKVTISTVGIPAQIRKLAEYSPPPKLVFSISSPHDEIRREVLPLAGRYTLKSVHEALSYYAQQTRHRITIALIVAEGLNDQLEDARALHQWIDGLPSKINLLRYNDAAGSFRRADEQAIERVAAELARLGRTVILRKSRGSDVSAACGQLAAREVRSGNDGDN